jgi:hypothetical protein
MRPPAEGPGYSGRGTPAVQHRGKSRLKRAAPQGGTTQIARLGLMLKSSSIARLGRAPQTSMGDQRHGNEKLGMSAATPV